MVLQHIAGDPEFARALDLAGPKPVVVDFFATWCGPCRTIAPIFEQLSNKYPQMEFLKVDVDVCQGTAQSQGVNAMPTFHFYVAKSKVDTLTGADPNKLEEKIVKWAATAPVGMANGEDSVPIPTGQVDLLGFVENPKIECLNGSDDTSLRDMLTGQSSLKSDCDEQLIMVLPFMQPIKLHSIMLKGPEDCGPKTVKLFINLPQSLDFDKAAATDGVQTLEFTPEQLAKGEPVNLRFVKFQNVQSVQLFIADNVGGGDVTVVDRLRLFGTPITATKMDDFKRVAGKKGEGGH